MKDHRIKVVKDLWEIVFLSDSFQDEIKRIRRVSELMGVDRKYIAKKFLRFRIKYNFLFEYPVRWDVIFFNQIVSDKLSDKVFAEALKFKKLRPQQGIKKALIVLYSKLPLKSLQEEAKSDNRYKDQLIAKIYDNKFGKFNDSITSDYVRKIIHEMKKFNL